MGMCTGNIIGPLLYSTDDAPLYRPGLISNLIMFVLSGILGMCVYRPYQPSFSTLDKLIICSLIPLYLMYLNKMNAKKREQLGKSANIVDQSMMRKKEMQESKAVELEQHEQQPRGLEEDNGLQDLSDLKNEDFIYVY